MMWSFTPLRCTLVLAGLLVGCAMPMIGHRNTPMLRLPPAALGRTLALHQQLVVESHGQVQRVEILLEADDVDVRLALLSLGQTVATLSWDGHHFRETQAAIWPASVRAARVLSDLQLVWWPVDAVREVLPVGWILRDGPLGRELAYGAEVVTLVRHLSPTVVELHNLRERYRLLIESISLN